MADSNRPEMGQSQRLEQVKRAEEWQDFDQRLVHNGKVRRHIVLKEVVKWFVGSFIVAHFLVAYYLDTYSYLVLDIQKHLQMFNPYEVIKYGLFNDLFIILGYSISFLISYVAYKVFSWKVYLIKLRFTSGLRNYRITKLKNAVLNFELEDGKELDDDQLARAIPSIAQQLGFQFGEYEYLNVKRGKIPKGVIYFTYKLPTKDEAIRGEVKSPSKKALKDDCLLIGVNDKEATPVYTSSISDKGRLAQHGLVVGGSGSGKSFFITNTLMSNFFDTKEHFQEYSHIKIIDFKGSGDYIPFQDYPNVEVLSGDPKEALMGFKDVEIERMARESYMLDNGLKTGDIPKYLFIIDEAQTIAENMASRQNRVLTNTWNNINQLLTTLTAKGRSANISMFVCLQKATAENISTTVRSNLQHRFCMKNDNMEMLIDEDVMKDMGIRPKRMEQGQFFYSDTITGGGLIKPCFAVPMPRLSSDEVKTFDNVNADFMKELNQYKQNAVDTFIALEEEMYMLEESGAIDLSTNHKNYLDEDLNKAVEHNNDMNSVMSIKSSEEIGDILDNSDFVIETVNPNHSSSQNKILDYGIKLVDSLKDEIYANKYFVDSKRDYLIKDGFVVNKISLDTLEIDNEKVAFPISDKHLLKMGIIKQGTMLELELRNSLNELGVEEEDIIDSLQEFDKEFVGLEEPIDWGNFKGDIL